jgi:hypothetical protein
MSNDVRDAAPPDVEDADSNSEFARARREIERAKAIVEDARRAVARSRELREEITRKRAPPRDEV